MDQCSVCRNTEMDDEHKDMCVGCADRVRAHEMCRICANLYGGDIEYDEERDLCRGCANMIRMGEELTARKR